MSLEEALVITGVREDELERINKDALSSIIDVSRQESDRFPYDISLKNKVRAYETIYEEVKKREIMA